MAFIRKDDNASRGKKRKFIFWTCEHDTKFNNAFYSLGGDHRTTSSIKKLMNEPSLKTSMIKRKLGLRESCIKGYEEGYDYALIEKLNIPAPRHPYLNPEPVMVTGGAELVKKPLIHKDDNASRGNKREFFWTREHDAKFNAAFYTLDVYDRTASNIKILMNEPSLKAPIIKKHIELHESYINGYKEGYNNALIEMLKVNLPGQPYFNPESGGQPESSDTPPP